MNSTLFIHQREDLKNMSRFTSIPVVIEMYKGYWSEELKNYSVRDLSSGGTLFEEPSLIKNEKTKHAIENSRYHIHPIDPGYFLKDSRRLLSNYIYITDDENNKMRVFNEKSLEER